MLNIVKTLLHNVFIVKIKYAKSSYYITHGSPTYKQTFKDNNLHRFKILSHLLPLILLTTMTTISDYCLENL
jgi:hypothetical protein